MFGISLFKSIRANVIFQIVVLFLLVSFNYVVVAYYDWTLSEVEKTIDIAGSNRTFSQQIALYTRNIMQGKEEERKMLKDVVEKHDINLTVLRYGGMLTGEKNAEISPIPADLQNTSFLSVQRLWTNYKKNAEIILNNPVFLKSKEINPEIVDASAFILDQAQDMLKRNNDFVDSLLINFDKQQARRDIVLLIIFVLNLFLLFILYVYIRDNVVRPISKLNEIDAIISEGNFERNISYDRDDELGRVGISVNRLFQNLKNATDFIIAIGEGRLDSKYQFLGENEARKDKLGMALLEMREKMINVAETDRQRNWVSEGLARFADIFRTSSIDEDFNYIIVSNLVKYVDANQGGLFLVGEQAQSEPYLELVAAYAYEKRKYLKKTINKGEGLIGEVFQEGSKVYITEVPDDYIHITSGLGDANPKSLLIIPLKLNNEIFGVIELASFTPIEDYKIEFVEKLSESIASTFASVKSNIKTQRLLQESIQLSEQMKAQEEEMRQNLEELVATQEDVQRKNQLLEMQKDDLEKMLEEEQKKVAVLESQYEKMRLTNEELRMVIRDIEEQQNAFQAQKDKYEKELETERQKYQELESKVKQLTL